MIRCIAYFFVITRIALAYQFKCPDDSQRHFRTATNCTQEDKYTCLYDTNKQQFVETCNGPTVFPDGSRGVYSINVDIKDCPNHLYQPFPFHTSRQSTCAFIKAGCSEEGQIKFDNGTNKKDISCICDSGRKFTFLMMNSQKYGTCVPSQEDCSCYQLFHQSSDINITFLPRQTTKKIPGNSSYNLNDSCFETIAKTEDNRWTCSALVVFVLIIVFVFISVVMSREIENCSEWLGTNVYTEIVDVKKGDAFYQEIAEHYGLSEYYPDKITVDDCRKRQCMSHQVPRHNIPWMILCEVLCLNCNCDRNKHWFFQGLPLDQSNRHAGVHNNRLVNPSDIYLIIYLCCSLPLKQQFISNLALRNYAIPFLYRNRFGNLVASRWALRRINLQYLKRNACFLNQQFVIVTFVRIGKQSSVSKSKILNHVLHVQYYPTFCDRSCVFAANNRITSVVEASWFNPYKNRKTRFSKSILFFNIRGDLTSCQEEMQILSEVSDLVVLLSDLESLNQTQNVKLLNKYQQVGPNMIYMLVSKKKHACLQIFREFRPDINLDDRKAIDENVAGEQLRKIINDETEKSNSKQMNDLLKKFKLTDENIPLCDEAKTIASNVIESSKKSNWRETPEQEVLWNEWLKLLHAQNYDTGREIVDKKKSIEYKLAKYCDKSFNFLEEFLKHLSEAKRKDKLLLYFWEWMNILSSHDCLDGETLLDLTFERIVFELSRQFEAGIFDCLQKKIAKGNRCWYPSVASRLLQMGQSLELVNGDTCLVPTDFIKSVFQELNEDLKGCKVNVVSILGSVASGKSTLLDSMFGLNDISFHKQTKGIRIALVKASKDIDTYFLLIDSQGFALKSRVEESYESDKQLALFVIGISHKVIINTKYKENKKENAYMLETVSNALLILYRSKDNLKYLQSVIFVKQGFSEQDMIDIDGCNHVAIMSRKKETLRQLCQNLPKDNSNTLKIFIKQNCHYIEISNYWVEHDDAVLISSKFIENVMQLKHKHMRHSTKDKKLLSFFELSNRIEKIWKSTQSEDFVEHYESVYSSNEGNYVECVNVF